MGSTSFAASPGSINILRVPSSMREYINENSAGRGFSLESFEIHHEAVPNRLVVDLFIGPHGAEQLEPFKVSLVLGDAAARQLAHALEGVLPKEAI